MKEHDIKSVAELRSTTITINDDFYLSIKTKKKLSKIYLSKDINLSTPTINDQNQTPQAVYFRKIVSIIITLFYLELEEVLSNVKGQILPKETPQIQEQVFPPLWETWLTSHTLIQ